MSWRTKKRKKKRETNKKKKNDSRGQRETYPPHTPQGKNLLAAKFKNTAPILPRKQPRRPGRRDRGRQSPMKKRKKERGGDRTEQNKRPSLTVRRLGRPKGIGNQEVP